MTRNEVKPTRRGNELVARKERTMNRKPALVLLIAAALLLPLTGLAQQQYTVAEIRAQAQDGWHKTYAAHGRTITVDIPVMVPAAERFPALTAVSAHPSALAPVTTFGTALKRAEQGYGIYNSEKVFTFSQPDAQTISDMQPMAPMPEGLVPVSEHFFIHQLDWYTPPAKDNPATLRDAHALMKRVTETYFPGEDIAFTPWHMEAYVDARPYDYDLEQASGEPWAPYAGLLFARFNQVLRGIPVLTYAEATFKQTLAGPGESAFFHSRPDNMAVIWPLTLYGRQDSMEQVYLMLLREEGVLAEDVPLCGLNKVLATYEELIAQGKLRWVDSLRLGYVGWYSRRNSEVMTLLPCWALDGMLYRSADSAKVGYRDETAGQANERSLLDAEYSTVLVNAQTGELIDPWRTDKNRSYDQPKLLQWK